VHFPLRCWDSSVCKVTGPTLTNLWHACQNDPRKNFLGTRHSLWSH